MYLDNQYLSCSINMSSEHHPWTLVQYMSKKRWMCAVEHIMSKFVFEVKVFIIIQTQELLEWHKI